MPDYTVWKHQVVRIPVTIEDVESEEEAIQAAFFGGGEEDDRDTEFIEYCPVSEWTAELIPDDAPVIRVPLQNAHDFFKKHLDD